MALRIPSCFTTIRLVRKMASFARVHRKPDAQQFGVTSTTLPFTLFCWTGHLYPTICSAQKDSLAIFILKSQPSQCSLFGRICISIASAKFSGPQKIGFTRESGLKNTSSGSQPIFFSWELEACIMWKESALFMKTMFPHIKYILTWT